MKFNEKYNRESFLQFVQEFLPSDFVEKEEDVLINKSRYKEIVDAKILGTCESLDLAVIEMDHKRENDPRITIATDAFKILADHWMHRALVIFKNNESDNYRLSYLTISLDINEESKVVQKYSNARRYSFYLGTNAKIRTPEQQLVKKGRITNLEDLLSRFSVEVVNKQFYFEIAKYFDELVSDKIQNLLLPSSSQNDINIRKSFAVRLIGRIMFCWFLKQKRSTSGNLIPDELLSSKAVKENYYHNTLEPLFFGALNTSIDARDIRSDLFDKVPYLNGGLFNPQPDDYYELDRGTFLSRHVDTLKISDSWFKYFFELLETYNFTIDENTIFDQELSVDPEMLGRIFENLLAEINPETGSSERKRTGSFYTPRQIVEYMVDQSLIEYFKTKTDINEKKLSALVSYDLIDDAEYPLEDNEKREIIEVIESLKILDPACGSGAYPIGALQKIVYILQQIDPECKLWLEHKLKEVPELYKQKIINEVRSNPFDYVRKLDVIKNSIFGVDIQPIAVDVSRLRCFLTLVVESEVNDSKPNRGIEPLPNLDFKFVCANTLISLPKSEDGQTSAFDDHSGIKELATIMSEYFSCNSQRKNEIKLKFINAQKQILEKTISAFGKSTGELTLKLTTWNPFSNASNSWFDPEWMFGLEEKFDIVIGNPPYLQLQKFRGQQIQTYLKNQNYKTHDNTGDIYCLFYERGINFSRPDSGLLCYITSNKWMLAAYGEKLRAYFSSLTPLTLVDLGSGVFESATVATNILIIQNKPSNTHSLRALTPTREQANDLMQSIERDSVIIKKLNNDPWSFGSYAEQALNNKIKNIGVPLKEKISYGVKTGLNEAFIIDKAKRDELIKEDPRSLDIIKPVLRGRDVKRYSYDFAELYIIIVKYGFAKELEKYPAVLKHLKVYEDKLRERGQCNTSRNGKKVKDGKLGEIGQHHWLELDNNPSNEYLMQFEKDRIVWGNLCAEPSFSWCPDGYYICAPTNMLIIEKCSLYLVLGILNSAISKYQLSKLTYCREGGYREYKKIFVEQIILPKIIEPKFAKEIELLVMAIMEKKKQNKNADTKDLEKQIDELVYELYGITPNEIEIIEEKTK